MIDETGSLPERMRRVGKFALLRREPGDVYFDRDQWRRRSGRPMPLALYWTPFRTGNRLAAIGTSSREFIGDSVDEIFCGNRFDREGLNSGPRDAGVFRWLNHLIDRDAVSGLCLWKYGYGSIAGSGTVAQDLLKAWPVEVLPRLAKCASLAEVEIVMEAYGG